MNKNGNDIDNLPTNWSNQSSVHIIPARINTFPSHARKLAVFLFSAVNVTEKRTIKFGFSFRSVNLGQIRTEAVSTFRWIWKTDFWSRVEIGFFFFRIFTWIEREREYRRVCVCFTCQASVVKLHKQIAFITFPTFVCGYRKNIQRSACEGMESKKGIKVYNAKCFGRVQIKANSPRAGDGDDARSVRKMWDTFFAWVSCDQTLISINLKFATFAERWVWGVKRQSERGKEVRRDAKLNEFQTDREKNGDTFLFLDASVVYPFFEWRYREEYLRFWLNFDSIEIRLDWKIVLCVCDRIAKCPKRGNFFGMRAN